MTAYPKYTCSDVDTRALAAIDKLMENGKFTNSTDAAKKLGISRSALTNIRAGRAHFTVNQLLALAHVYGVSPLYLFGHTKKMFTTWQKRLTVT